ncbi:amino acid ABC transporter permease [Motilibacter deserti]|uniref:Amino acid ABC transporter permease n=1 Tax=Motilibacter deserti TaxID=2714956 RepID=A0ABX0GVF2_9ACTN|nr:amino acid ABC transporter permease [Motilibacter deserti]NHC13619.1 amino acid ABC transporter permease [Motilibacter deserti]
MSTVLYDAAGPRARNRYRLYGLLTTLAVVAVLAYVVWKFYDTGQFSGRKWSIFQYEQVQRTLLSGLGNTLKAAATGAVLALAFGVLFAFARLSDRAWVRVPAGLVVELFRALPVVVMIFLIYYGTLANAGSASTFWSVVIALTIYNGSVLAEVFRAGIAAVPRGQSEAAYAIGLRKSQVLRMILLPQAVRAMLPAIISQLVVLLKDTALGFLITYRELLTEARQLASYGEFEFPTIPVAIVVGAIYIVICLALSLVATWLERRNRERGRRRTADRNVQMGAGEPDAGA